MQEIPFHRPIVQKCSGGACPQTPLQKQNCYYKNVTSFFTDIQKFQDPPTSSSRAVLAEIPDSDRTHPLLNLDLDHLPVERSLGLQWNTETDAFRFSVSSGKPVLTKRGVLSQVASVFYPLGVLATFLFPAKCLIQTLWRKKKDWDEPLDDGDKIVWDVTVFVTPDTCFLTVRSIFRLSCQRHVWLHYDSSAYRA